jgi:hypothetical protein
MFREDAESQLPLTGREREQEPFQPSPLAETDSSFRTPLLKSLLRKDIIGFMGRFFVSRFPS